MTMKGNANGRKRNGKDTQRGGTAQRKESNGKEIMTIRHEDNTTGMISTGKANHWAGQTKGRK